MITIVPIVEGPGDERALPVLLRNVFSELHSRFDLSFPVVKSNGRQKLEREFGKFLQYAANRPDCEGILVVLDADNDCPVEVASALKSKADSSGISHPIQIVCAHRSYESWFLASIETIRGTGGISDSASIEGRVEDIANPKAWLTDQMPRGRRYKETTDQPALSSRISIELAYANSRSFRQLCIAVKRLIDSIA